MNARDIADLFADLELRLVESLRRNLARHKAQEKEEGGQNDVPEQWSAWQAEKLRNLNRFRRKNKTLMQEYTSRIDANTKAMLEEQFAEADGSDQSFFGVNADKLDALITEMQHNEAKVEQAALRYMDDVYRKTILRADAAFAAGGVTMQQAVDLATKDFLEAGIHCVRYKNGRMVNIATYAEMALRTSNTRAMLLGEAQKRQRMGIDTVLVSQYGACSNTCLPWQGLVYIDDVWQPYSGPHTQGGTYGVSCNGHQYPLLSVAVKAGLFHPNCRHTLSTWIGGISVRPQPMDKAAVERTAKLEQTQRALERQVRKAKRKAAGLLDPEAVKHAKAEVRQAQKAVREFVNEHGDVLRRDYWRERYDGTNLLHGRSSGGSSSGDVTAENLPEQIAELEKTTNEDAIAYLSEVEKRTVGLPNEVDYTILVDGTVWRTKGTAGEVHPEAIQIVHGKSLAGSYSYHNHPADKTHYSFSGEDVGFFIEYGVQYSQASDDQFVYFLERTPETISAKYDDVMQTFKELLRGEVREMEFNGLIDADLDEYHTAIKFLSEKYYFRYERERRHGG